MAKSKQTEVEQVEETNSKAFVKIQSSISINVTMGLNFQDVTNKDAHVPDRLKINPLWPKAMVMIHKGAHWYPAEIANWTTVKKLNEKGIITIGEFSDTASDEVVEEKKTLKRKVKEVEAKTSLDEIAED